MHSKIQTTFIGTQESVYRDSPAGKLEEIGLVRTTIIPLQQGFDSDSKARLPVGIDHLSALALEQGIVGTMPFPNSTAVGTPFARVPAINNVQMNMIIEASLLKDLPETEERDTHDGLVEPLAFGAEPPELLNCDVSVISVSDSYDFPDHLPEIGLDKVVLSVSCISEFSGGFEYLEQILPSHQLLPPCPDVPSEISLVENFAFGGHHADGKLPGVNVYSENILSVLDLDFFFLGEICNNLQTFSQSEGLASPAVLDEGLEPLVAPVMLDGNGCPVSGIHSKLNEEVGLGFECLAVSGNIELDRQPVDISGFLLPSVPDKGASDLNIEGGFFLAG